MPQCLWFAIAGHRDILKHKPTLEGRGPSLPSLLAHIQPYLGLAHTVDGHRDALGPQAEPNGSFPPLPAASRGFCRAVWGAQVGKGGLPPCQQPEPSPPVKPGFQRLHTQQEWG